MSTPESGFFSLQNSIVSLQHMEKHFIINFEHYDLASGKECV
jgi:hypothetical protein